MTSEPEKPKTEEELKNELDEILAIKTCKKILSMIPDDRIAKREEQLLEQIDKLLHRSGA